MESSPQLKLVPGPGGPGTRQAIRVLLGVVVLVLIVFPAMMRLAADLFWFREIGFQRVFTTELVTKFLLFAIVATVSYALLAVNLRVARRGGSPANVFSGPLPESLTDLIERLPRLTTPAAIVFAILAGISASAAWMTVLQFLNGAPFGMTDPVFNRDIGFYTFVMPGLAMLLGLLSTLTVLAVLLSGFVYLVRGEIRPPSPASPKLMLSPRAGAHLGVLVIVFLLLAAARIWVVRNSEGVFAIYARCTHLGCTPDWKEGEHKFKCPCHGSGFDSEGINFEGPAPRPMDRARIELAPSGQIVVDTADLYKRDPFIGIDEFGDDGAILRGV